MVKKRQVMQMIGLIRPMLIKIWNCIVGIIFYGLILDHHEFIFSYAQARKNLKSSFGGHFIHFFPHKVTFEVTLEI